MCVTVNLYKKRFRENKSNISFRAGCVSDGIKNKHLPRINTELHGKDRSRDTEGRISRSIATELHGRKKKRKN